MGTAAAFLKPLVAGLGLSLAPGPGCLLLRDPGDRLEGVLGALTDFRLRIILGQRAKCVLRGLRLDANLPQGLCGGYVHLGGG